MIEGPSIFQIKANTGLRRKAKCTPKKCIGTKHSPAECCKKPGNKHLMQEWVAKRQRLGLGCNQSNTSSSTTIQSHPQPTQAGLPSVEALQASFDCMTMNTTSLVAHPSTSFEHSTAAIAFPTAQRIISSLIDTGATHHLFPD